jgi:threonine dehydratase
MSDTRLPSDWQPPTSEDVLAAARRIAGRVHRTPVVHCSALDALLGGKVFFKCENLQRIGAFKARGATNAVLSLSREDAVRGVASHSSGNHGAALAMAAHDRGIPCWVVVPDNAPIVKRESVAREGATVLECQPGLTNRESALARVVEETGASPVHPYDDDRVIAGQGTAALELMQDVWDLRFILTPIGGGGLVSGTAIAARGEAPDIRVVACEPEQADDACRSFREGRRITIDSPETIADGLRASIGERNFRVVTALVDDVVTVPESAIVAAMRLIWERLRIVIEPSAAVPVAALLEREVRLEGGRAGVILTGGNVDLDSLPWG